MMKYDQVVSTKDSGVKLFDHAMTMEEYLNQGTGPAPEPTPDLTEEERTAIVLKGQQAHVRAVLQLIYSHRTEYERRLQKILQEADIAEYFGSEWLDTLEDLQQTNQ